MDPFKKKIHLIFQSMKAFIEPNVWFSEQITSVDSLVFTSVSCGETHSMALNEWGQLYTWGSDSCCQLGRQCLTTNL